MKYIPGILNNKKSEYFKAIGNETPDINEAFRGFLQHITPGTYTTPTNFNRKYIRSQRDNYRTVDDYWNYLQSNKNSEDYNLWNNVLSSLDTDDAKKQAFYEIINQYGIKGNLGIRDSGRLSNILNVLKSIGTPGSEDHNNFVDNWNLSYTDEIKKRNNIYQPNLANVNTSYDLSKWNSFKFKQGGLISRNPVTRFLLKGGTFKLAFDKARAEGNRYFFYDDGSGIKTYNTMKKGEDKSVWAKNFKDNLTSGGADNVLTSINRGWSGEGASHGRYNSKGEYVKFNKPSNVGPLAAKGDHINDNGDRGWGLADLPEEAVDLGRGTNRGKHTANVNTGVDIGNYVPTVLSGIIKLTPWQKVGKSKSLKNEIKIGNLTYKRGMIYSHPGYYNNLTGYFTKGNDIYLRSLKGGKYLDLKVGVIKNGEQYYNSDSDNIVTYDEYRKFLGADKNKFMGQDILKSNIVIPQEMPSFNDMRNKYNVTWHKNTHFKNFK